MVSCENSKFPELGTDSKSFRQELHNSMVKIRTKP
jgi:hypothetical protein